MKITLDSREEVNNYFNYLIETDSLFDSVPTVNLVDEAATAYLSWLSNSPLAADTGRSYQPWSSEDATQLVSLINSGRSITDICLDMGRTENGIRSYARKSLNLVLRNGVWQTFNPTKE